MKHEVVIVELEDDMVTVKQTWSSMSGAAREKGVSKQRIHTAIREETMCAGSYWLTRDRWETREAIRRENKAHL